MQFLTEKSVLASSQELAASKAAKQFIELSAERISVPVEKKVVFSQVDLWKLQKHMKTIHVTDRFPRTWEGNW